MVKSIEVHTEVEMKAVMADLAHILHNLRFYTKYWNEHGGYQARNQMKIWEQKADTILNSLGLRLHNNISAVTIIKY